jgi:glutamine synthetase
MGTPAPFDGLLPASGLTTAGEMVMLPDLAAARALPWAPGHAIAPVDMMKKGLGARGMLI